MILRNARPPSSRFSSRRRRTTSAWRGRRAVRDRPGGRTAAENAKRVSERSQTSPTPRIENGLHRPRAAEGRTSSSVFSAVSDSTRSGLRTAHSQPIGPPMSWTTRWQRSIPSASSASPVQPPRPAQRVVEAPRAVRPSPSPGKSKATARRPSAASGGKHLAVEEAARGNAVQQHHRSAVALARGRSSATPPASKLASRRPVLCLDHLARSSAQCKLFTLVAGTRDERSGSVDSRCYARPRRFL